MRRARNPPARAAREEWTGRVPNPKATNTREIVMSNADNTERDEHDEKTHDSAASGGSESQEEGEAAMDAAEDAVVDHGRD
jgi:hypothetical protein